MVKITEDSGYYDNMSKNLDDYFMKYLYEKYRFDEITKSLLNLIPKRQGLTVLDVGCGTGGLTESLSKVLKKSYIMGIDFSEGMIEVASKKLPDCKFKVGDAHNIPFEDCIFDIVVSREVLEHLENPIEALKEMRRVVKEEGYVIVSTPSWLGLIAPLYFIKKKIFAMQPIDNWWTPFSLKRAFVDAGLKVEIMDGVNPTPYHGGLPDSFIPVVKKLDKSFLKIPITKYFCRTLVVRALPR